MVEAATVAMRLRRCQPVLPLQVPLLAGSRFDLAQQTPDRFSPIVFYPGAPLRGAANMSARWLSGVGHRTATPTP
jgi:hypothetical protein